MLSTESLTCPWCLAPISLVIDASAGDQSYIEDCEVCCQPMLVHVRMSGEELLSVEAERDE
ncbi:MAG: CPXCG motif-containing cysteine-rich protein [Gammaproteobacteria bacterium]|nr:CPXCG motif-containing cysteine-rich protein [Gammaproteobacteria bacterium]